MKYLFFVILGLFIITCSVKKQPDLSFCDTENLGIDTIYRYTPMSFYHPDGTPYFSTFTWKWTTSNDTIIIWGNVNSGGEAGITRYMYFKKNCDCINLLNVKETYCSDTVEIDSTGNIVDPCITYDINNVDLHRQEYVEDSLLVGQVGVYAFWLEFSPQFYQNIP